MEEEEAGGGTERLFGKGRLHGKPEKRYSFPPLSLHSALSLSRREGDRSFPGSDKREVRVV